MIKIYLLISPLALYWFFNFIKTYSLSKQLSLLLVYVSLRAYFFSSKSSLAMKYMRHCCCYVASVVSDSVRPHKQQSTRLPCPWDSPGKNTGEGCHFLLQCVKVKSLSRVQLIATPWTVAHQALPSMGFSRQEYWSGVPLPSPI